MKKLSIVIVMLTLMSEIKAQNIDMVRMDRDIEIAKNILLTLSNKEGKNTLYFGTKVDGSYLEGYGVILSLPKNVFYVNTRIRDRNIAVVAPSSGFNYRISTSDEHDVNVVVDEIQSKKSKEAKEVKEKRKVKEQVVDVETDETMITAMKTFLVDYADLIGQLQPSERIKIVSKNDGHEFWVGDEFSKKSGSSKSSEILKSDLIEYKKGKITREEVMDRVVITVKEVDAAKNKDLEIFAGIFSRLYEPDFSRTYYSMRHALNYEYLENFGVIFNMKVYSSNSNDGLHTIRTTGERGLTQEERDKKVVAMYSDFEQSLKENMLDYGRTIRSLKPEEVLLFKVKLTECRGCDMPRSIDVSVKASILAEYNTGKLTRDSAIKMVSVKKNN